jgi:UDP-glucose 4-epimerase
MCQTDILIKQYSSEKEQGRNMKSFDGKRILVTGGTGSLGNVLVRRLLKGEMGTPEQILVFSRDEAKQHFMRLDYMRRKSVTDDVIYKNFQDRLAFRIGDVRDYHSLSAVMTNADIVINAAALKQVPTCEYFPFEAVETNIGGAENIVRAIREHDLEVETVIGVSTDKACKPVNVMGMTKAIQERVFIRANLDCPNTRFICVRYGNVLASRGSVIPYFHEQINCGGPVTITTTEMTRFLLNLDHAVDTIFRAYKEARRGETYVPKVPSVRVVDIADILIGERPIKKIVVGIRPGEKNHEILVSEEESIRTVDRGRFYAIQSILPEIMEIDPKAKVLGREFSSADNLMSKRELATLLRKNRLMIGDRIVEDREMVA